MLTKGRVIQLLIMLIVLIGLFVWRTMSNDAFLEQQNKLKSEPQIAEIQMSKTDLACDYVTPCEFINGQGYFWLNIEQVPIKPEQWNHFSVSSDLENWKVIDAKIVGKDMFMGRIPVDFSEAEQGVFSAKFLVGACTTDKMVWQLQINIEVEGVKDQLLFDFTVYR